MTQYNSVIIVKQWVMFCRVFFSIYVPPVVATYIFENDNKGTQLTA